MPFDRAALLGCAVITGSARRATPRIRRGTTSRYSGAAVSVSTSCRARAWPVPPSCVGVDLDDAKLQMARKFGATHPLRGDAPDLHKALRALTRERAGLDFAFEAVGNAEVARVAFLSITKVRRGDSRRHRSHEGEGLRLPQIAAVTQEKGVRGTTNGSADSWTTGLLLIELYPEEGTDARRTGLTYLHAGRYQRGDGRPSQRARCPRRGRDGLKRALLFCGFGGWAACDPGRCGGGRRLVHADDTAPHAGPVRRSAKHKPFRPRLRPDASPSGGPGKKTGRVVGSRRGSFSRPDPPRSRSCARPARTFRRPSSARCSRCASQQAARASVLGPASVVAQVERGNSIPLVVACTPTMDDPLAVFHGAGARLAAWNIAIDGRTGSAVDGPLPLRSA